MTKYEPKADKIYLRILEEWLKKHPENECSALTVQDLIATIRHAEACLQEREAAYKRLKETLIDILTTEPKNLIWMRDEILEGLRKEELTCPIS